MSGTEPVPSLPPGAQRGLGVVWGFLEEHREELEASLLEVALDIPSLAALAEQEPDQAEQERSRGLQRAAMLDGAWSPYLADLRRQGRGYASAGVPFRAWYRLMRAHRNDVQGLLLDALSDQPGRLVEALVGLHRWLDLAMEAMTEGYLDQRRALIEQAQERFELAVAASGLGVWEWEQGELHLDVRARELLGGGSSTDEILERVHPDDRGLVAAMLGQEGDPELEFRVRPSEGGRACWRMIKGRVEWDAQGQPQRAIGVILDQDTLRRVQRERAVFASFFEESSLGLQVYRWEAPPDPGSFRLIEANSAARALSDESDDEIALGLTLDEADSPVLDTPVAGWFAECLRTGEAMQWDIGWPVRGQSTRYFDVRCFPIGDDTLGLVYEDVTERHETQSRLERYVVDLERSNEELDQFAYVASHDLKAPLRDVDNLSRWIVEDMGDDVPDESKRHLELLQGRVRRMEQLLDDLLQYARIGRQPVEAERVDVAALLREHAALVATGDELDLHLAPDLPEVHSPRAPLAQVFRNLIGNAVAHRTAEQVRVEVDAELRDDGRVAFRVRDDGPGIEPRFQDRIFGMFTTLQSRDDVETSGMGLAIVRKLVESYGGWITVDSAPGEGASFTFTWPRRVGPGGRS